MDYSDVFNSSVLEDVFASSVKAPECNEILFNCLKNVENQMKDMTDSIKSTKTSQTEGKLRQKYLQESVYFIKAKFHEYKKDKKEKNIFTRK